MIFQTPTFDVHGKTVEEIANGVSAYHELTFTALRESLNCRFARHGIQCEHCCLRNPRSHLPTQMHSNSQRGEVSVKMNLQAPASSVAGNAARSCEW